MEESNNTQPDAVEQPAEAASTVEQTPAGEATENAVTPPGEAATDAQADQRQAGEFAEASEAAPAEEAPEDDGATRPGFSWCVLRVASNKEETVREALERRIKIEGLHDVVGRILVPTEKRPNPRGRGGSKFVERKMYPGYVFIEMKLSDDGSIDDQAWFTIKETTGVGDFIGSAGKPSPMAQGDVDKMLQQVAKAQEGGQVSVEFEKGDMVKIKEGAFENFEGAVEDVLPEKGLVRVVVTIFGRATPVELEFWQVEKV
ncbi:MAG: transcription termination/antitermination factor NusG [Planctomycetes bacterium]|jgi:transcriptional antiterminator NusG|nr:transcription termination/antitermination factor NusG [Planctomycetota bacterium]